MSTKIMLDVGALEHLLEVFGPEFALELRTATINEFARRHVKAVVSDEVKHMLTKETTAAMRAEYGLIMQGDAMSNTHVTFSDKIKGAVRQHIKRELGEIISAEVLALQNTVNERADASFEAKLEVVSRTIANRLNVQVEKMIAEEVKRRVENAMAMLDGQEERFPIK